MAVVIHSSLCAAIIVQLAVNMAALPAGKTAPVLVNSMRRDDYDPYPESKEYQEASEHEESQAPDEDTKIVPLDEVENAPDPLSLEELLHIYNINKNEVKRQENVSVTPPADTASTSEGPSLTDLAASFGGGDTAPADADVNDQLPQAKPNGLYFLLDWNSFLEVGEEDKNKVNLRFAPKVGNSRNFLPVRVP